MGSFQSRRGMYSGRIKMYNILSAGGGEQEENNWDQETDYTYFQITNKISTFEDIPYQCCS